MALRIRGNRPSAAEVTVIYETFPGWEEDLSKVRTFAGLPQQAQTSASPAAPFFFSIFCGLVIKATFGHI